MENLKNRKNFAKKILSFLLKEYGKVKTKLKYKNNFELLIAVILSAQTTDEQVNRTTKKLFKVYNSPIKLAKAKNKDIEKIIKPTGYYKQKTKYIISTSKKLLKDFNSKVPSNIEDLLSLPGVGRKTANIILSFGFNKHEGIAVDTHCKRVSYRIGITKIKENPFKIEKDLVKIIPKKYWGIYTNLMIAHGRRYCKAKKPLCKICPIEKMCEKNGIKKEKAMF
ncbi:MAG: endonuclease III [Candidatus Anstonellaceae archaeon]